MASKPNVPFSTTQGSPSLSSFAGSFPIRAPITPDDDSSDFESKTDNVYTDTSSIDNGSESEYVSGEEFESASEKHFVGNPDEENHEDSRFLGKYQLSRPYVASIDNGSESEYVSGEEFESASEKHFVGNPDEENHEDSRFLGKYQLSRPYVADPDDESLGNSVIDEEDSGVTDEFDHVVHSVSPNLRLGMPIAQLSMDDDELEELIFDEPVVSGDEEDKKFEGIVKVPNVGVLERVDSAPRVKVSDVEEDKEYELLLQNELLAKEKEELALGKFVANSGSEGSVVGLVDDAEPLVENKDDSFKKNLELSENVNHVVLDSDSSELVKDDDPAVVLEAQIESLVEIKEDTLEKSSLSNDDAENFLAEVPELEVDSTFQLKEQTSEMLDGNTVETVINPVHESVQKIVPEAPEAEKATTFDNEQIVAIDRSVGHEKGSDSEKLEYETAQLTGMILESFAPETVDIMNNDRLMDDIRTVDLVENGHMPELSEADVQSNASFGIKDEVNLESGNIGMQKDTEDLIFGGSEATEHIVKESEKSPASSAFYVGDEFHDHAQKIDGQIVPDSDEEMEIVKEHIEKKSVDNVVHASQSDMAKEVFDNSVSEEEKKLIGKIHLIRVKFLRLVQRLGLSLEDSVVAQVLYRLVLAAGGHVSQEFSLEFAKREALQLESMGRDDLDFCLNILVIGKTGVGKSATINSIFGEKKVMVNAFEPATNTVKEIIGTVNGVRIRVLDTPGLRTSVKEEATNRKILASIKKLTKKFPPDVVLYVDRLDTHARDLNDLPLLVSLTNCLTASIWRNAIVTLTHAAAPPPDGPHGSPLSFEMFVARRSHVVQQAISQAVGHIRMMVPSMMHPVSLVENHPSGQKNENGESIVPNGQSWRPQLLLLCYSLKILSEASGINKPQNPFDHNKLFGLQLCSLPLPHLVSSLLQSRSHPKLTAEQGGDDVDSDMELLDLSVSDEEEEDEYDQLPPFKPLKKYEVNKLSKEQRKAYFEEYDYRVKLLQKKQLKEEVKRLKELKKKGKDSRSDHGLPQEDLNQEDEGPATVLVSMPDFVLPPSFDSDNPSYRYRMLEPTSQLLVRPVLDSQGWDHDIGYDGVSLERNLAISGQFPGAIAVQITKDKKEFNLHLDSTICAKHGENGSTMAGFDIQNIGRQLAYILRTETKFKNFKLNKTSAGMCITLSGKNVATGLKIEDQIAVGKRWSLVGGAGAVRSKGDTAYGANFEIRLKSKDFPVEQDQSTFSLSLMKWKGDLGLMANLQSQFLIGRDSKMAIQVGMNHKKSGQITIKTSSSELQVALITVLPMLVSIIRNVCPGSLARNSSMVD